MRCPECHGELPDPPGRRCPHCRRLTPGARRQRAEEWRQMSFVIVFAVALLVFVAFMIWQGN